MPKKKKSRGGPREGSGRKPVEDKVVPLTIYVKESTIELLTAPEAKYIAITAINRAAVKKKKKKK